MSRYVAQATGKRAAISPRFVVPFSGFEDSAPRGVSERAVKWRWDGLGGLENCT